MTIVCGFGCTFVGLASSPLSADGAINYDVSEIIFNIIDDAFFMTRKVKEYTKMINIIGSLDGCMTQHPIHHLLHVPLLCNPQAFKLMIK